MATKKDVGFLKSVGIITPLLLLATVPLAYFFFGWVKAKSIEKVDGLNKLLKKHYEVEKSYPADENATERKYAVTVASNKLLVKALSVDPDEIIPIPGKEKAVAVEFPAKSLSDEGALLDPWGNPYYYRENLSKNWSAESDEVKTGKIHDPKRFDLWSAGPDGKTNQLDPSAPENDDDITGW